MTDNAAQVKAAIGRLLSEDEDIAELGIESVCDNDVVVLRGRVNSAARRDLIADRVAEAFPEIIVRNDVAVVDAGAPTDREDLP